MDPFVIYDNTIGYSHLREKISDILYHGKRLEKLQHFTEVRPFMNHATIPSIYTEVAL